MTNDLVSDLLSLKPFLEAHHCRTDAIDRAIAAIEQHTGLVAENEPAKAAYWDRPNGDAGDALDYALDHIDDPFARLDFLECWRSDDLEEWPDFHCWLKVQHDGARESRAALAHPQGEDTPSDDR